MTTDTREPKAERQDDPILAEIRSEQQEARALAIRTEHALRNLATEVRQVQLAQQRAQTGSLLTSGVAYVLFALLTFAGLFLFFQMAIERNRTEAARATERVAQLERSVDQLEEQVEAGRRQEREAWAFFELIEADRHDQAIDRFPQLQRTVRDRALIELFRRELDREQLRLARESHEAGMRFFRAGRYEEARDALLRSRTLSAIAPAMDERSLHIAESLHALREYRDAAVFYEEALAQGSLSRAEESLAAFRFAESLERSGQRAEALAAYDEFTRQFRSHRWATTARERSGALTRALGAESAE